MSEKTPGEHPHDRVNRETHEKPANGDRELHRVHDQLLRENKEPTEKPTPMPLFLSIFMALMSAWAGVYLVKYSGNFDPMVYDETVIYGPGGGSGGASAEFDPVRAGQRFYVKNCVVCHQDAGQGVAGQFPPLAGSDWVNGPSRRLIKLLLHGMQGPVLVNGKSYEGVMPAFGTNRDRDIAAVLTFIRTNEAWGNSAPPVEEAAVAAVRKEFAGRSAAWDGAILQREDQPDPVSAEEAEADEHGIGNGGGGET